MSNQPTELCLYPDLKKENDINISSDVKFMVSSILFHTQKENIVLKPMIGKCRIDKEIIITASSQPYQL